MKNVVNKPEGGRIIQPAAKPEPTAHPATQRLVRGAGILLAVTVWLSAGLFGLYIIAFYASSLWGGNMEKWNGVLPGLYDKTSATSTAAIGIHFATGGVILILGSVQLIDAIRIKYPAVHRWVGRLYVVACLAAAVGGLGFIALKGTIGGTVMNVGFGLYGVLMLICATETWRHARAGRMEKHRAWALRLYALAIGSWLYRIDYGFWFLLAGKAGHLDNFTGITDRVMAFFFYLPNLLVAEAFIRSQRRQTSAGLNALSVAGLLFITALLLTGTYYFTKFYWGPAIVNWIAG